MGNYSFSQVLKQEPAGLVTVLALINAAAMSFNLYSMTDKQLSVCNAALLAVLTLLYIRPLTVSKAAIHELSQQPSPTPPPVSDGVESRSDVP